MARYGRVMRDLRRTGRVSGWQRSKQTYKRKRSGKPRPDSRRTAGYYLKRGESRVTGQPAAEVGRGRQPAKTVGKRKKTRGARAGRWISSMNEIPVPSRPRRL